MLEPVIHIDADLHERLKKHCRVSGCSMKKTVQRLVVGYLRQISSGIVEQKQTEPPPKSLRVQLDPWVQEPFWAMTEDDNGNES